jgi:hypothetical protein
MMTMLIMTPLSSKFVVVRIYFRGNKIIFFIITTRNRGFSIGH